MGMPAKRVRSTPLEGLATPRRRSEPSAYDGFSRIDGSHEFRKAVPDAFVSYQVRTRHGGEVAYFNFGLAKEMGLLPGTHPHALNDELKAKLLETFALVIINEYDILHKRNFDKSDIRQGTYMATRYLQLQHPGKRGYTSGDGRSIWNGQFSHRGKTWDVTSCGTGATCLSPATATQKKFFRTGDPKVSYGCGYASLNEGLNAALMSEILHRNGVATERTLAIIHFGDGHSINVRAGQNLLRPSHIFRYLKQENFEGLRGIVDYFIAREVANGKMPEIKSSPDRYRMFLSEIATNFAHATAQFESEYIFCWLDWDGDNVLASGAGIIDYGSVRQFGLFHREYRYDDVDRLSTSIPEQKKKARYTVQTFAQLVDFLIRKNKQPIENFKNDASLEVFERVYQKCRDEFLLKRLGLTQEQTLRFVKTARPDFKRFQKLFYYFEEKQSTRGRYRVADGITSDAVFCMRDVLRELPKHFVAQPNPLDCKTFLGIAASSYARRSDLQPTRSLRRRIDQFQKSYLRIVQKLSRIEKVPLDRLLATLTMRSSTINQYDRITGDSIIKVTYHLMRKRKELSPEEFLQTVVNFVDYQTLVPQNPKLTQPLRTNKVFLKLVDIVRDCRESL